MTRDLRRTGRFILPAMLATFALGALALPPGTDEEIFDRIKPIGVLNAPEVMEAVAEAVPAGPRGGEEIFNSYCTACHAAATAAALGAPGYGDAASWAPRIAKGIEALYESTYNGLNGVMPVRGTCMDCSDEELQATVDYMVAAAEG
ncbi:MAG: c-type cytochrome [Pseudomonadota bacterium]|nr:c-type cytochrome [Pseudomonadota bacterium]